MCIFKADNHYQKNFSIHWKKRLLTIEDSRETGFGSIHYWKWLKEATNTSRVFHVETRWKQSFPHRFNVEYTWYVCRSILEKAEKPRLLWKDQNKCLQFLLHFRASFPKRQQINKLQWMPYTTSFVKSWSLTKELWILPFHQ